MFTHTLSKFIFLQFLRAKVDSIWKTFGWRNLISQPLHKFRKILSIKLADLAIGVANAVVCEANWSNSSTTTAARVSAISFPLKPVTSPLLGSVSQQQQNVKHLSKKIQSFFFFHTTQLFQSRKERKSSREKHRTAVKTWNQCRLVFISKICLCDIKTFAGENPQKLLQQLRGINRQNSDAIRQKNIEKICAVTENTF